MALSFPITFSLAATALKWTIPNRAMSHYDPLCATIIHYVPLSATITSKCLVIKLNLIHGCIQGDDSEFDSCFLKFCPKILFFAKFDSELSKCFVLNETRCKGIIKSCDSEFSNGFLKFHPQNIFLSKLDQKVQIGKEYSRILILGTIFMFSSAIINIFETL